jgi:Flagellar biosynthesis pathway, component FliR
MFPYSANEAAVQLIFFHLLVSIRFLAMFTTASAFMLPSMPQAAKFWLAAALALSVTPALDLQAPTLLLDSWTFVFVLGVREFLIGAAIGFVSSLPLYALQISGFLDSTFMGFNMMNVFDPLSSAQVSVLAQMKYLLAIWFYLRWDGHILLVQALAESVRLVPPGVSMWDSAHFIPWIDWLQRAFMIALRISLPILGSILLAEVGLGFVARTVPQMNVFILGIPIKIGVGFVVLLTILPSSVDIFHGEIERAVRTALEGIHFLR